jgi:NitT/TauT family transport system permease protein
MLRGLYSRHVREALETPTGFGSDAILLALVLSIFGALLMLGHQMSTPYHEQMQIDLSIWSLPKYTVLTLGRGFAAYFLSLTFTLAYGTYAAQNWASRWLASS